MTFATAELYDEHGDKLQVVLPYFSDYGGKKIFHGSIVTVKVHEDNTLIRTTLEENGAGKVLVIDGGESMRCALIGDMLAQLGKDNGWSGIVVSGCIRDSAVIATIDIGVKALGTNPRKSVKKGAGDRDIPVTFAGVTFCPGQYLYADQDGIVVATEKIM
jgi:regulator of ribonuclease activity A